MFAAATKTVGVGVHGWRDTIDWKIMRRLAMGSIPAAMLTLIALNTFIHIGTNTNHAILDVLGVLLILTAIGILFQRKLLAYGATHHPVDPGHALVPTVALGAALGAMVTISSVGAGAIGVTVLLMLYRRLPVARIVGTDIAHAVPLALVAGTGHWFLGSVDFVLLLNLLVGSIPGVIAGSLLSSRARRWPRCWWCRACACCCNSAGRQTVRLFRGSISGEAEPLETGGGGSASRKTFWVHSPMQSACQFL